MRGLVPQSVWIVVAAVVGLHLACLGGYGYYLEPGIITSADRAALCPLGARGEVLRIGSVEENGSVMR